MMKKAMYIGKHKSLCCSIIATICVVLLLTVKNYEKETFFSASLVDIVTIIIAVFITYALTMSEDDRQRRNQCIEQIVLEIEALVINESVFSGQKNVALMKQRSCANRIKYLKDAGFEDINSDILFIENHFKEIRDLYSNHQNDLHSVRTDFERHQNLISDKYNKIRVGLYS